MSAADSGQIIAERRTRRSVIVPSGIVLCLVIGTFLGADRENSQRVD